MFILTLLALVMACNKKDTTEENTELPGKVSFDYKLNGESLKHVTIINNKDFKKSEVRGDSDGWFASIYAKDQTMSISISWTQDFSSKKISLLFFANGQQYDSGNQKQNVDMNSIGLPFNGTFSGSFDGIQISNGLAQDVQP